jgi:hypothetical protein
MKNQSYLNLKPCEFKRRFGVKIETLKAMVNALDISENNQSLCVVRAC